MSGLTGAKALVTGGSGGLGLRIARALAAEGVDLALAYRTGAERAEAACAEVEAAGGRAVPVQLDLTDPASVEAGVAAAAEALGGLDILVNNAGVASAGHNIARGDLDAFTPEIFDAIMSVNVRGPYLAARAAAPWLRKSRLGRIVNIGSTIAEGPFQAGAIHTTAKGAAVPLTRFLAAALAPDVTVNCVAPGLMEGTLMSGAASESYVDGWRSRAVLGATTSMEDVAAQVVTFCRSATTTGQVLVIDGGVNFA